MNQVILNQFTYKNHILKAIENNDGYYFKYKRDDMDKEITLNMNDAYVLARNIIEIVNMLKKQHEDMIPLTPCSHINKFENK